MNWVAAALIASAGVPIARAVWANRRTTLAHALGWVIAAWFAWISATIVGTASTRYLALALTACAGVAVLGARRPGVAAWNAVVAALLTVLLVPLGSRILSDTPRPSDAPYAIFLFVLLLVGIGNYISTRLTFAAVTLAIGCAVAISIQEFNADSGESFFAQLFIGLAPWSAWLRIAERQALSWQGDRLWRDFRDRFGVVWAQRLREQFNAAAANAKLPVELGWGGLRRADAASLSDEDRARCLELLRALMTRFGLS
jgi:hypothetical protein